MPMATAATTALCTSAELNKHTVSRAIDNAKCELKSDGVAMDDDLQHAERATGLLACQVRLNTRDKANASGDPTELPSRGRWRPPQAGAEGRF